MTTLSEMAVLLSSITGNRGLAAQSLHQELERRMGDLRFSGAARVFVEARSVKKSPDARYLTLPGALDFDPSPAVGDCTGKG
jgi:hypothetical protein